MSENKTQEYSEILLGDSMDIILAAADADTPRVSESVFVEKVLPYLEHPFYHVSMVEYVKWVKELTNPLRVCSDANPAEVLFEVPPFIQTTGVTMPAPGHPTTDQLLKDLYMEGERGANVNEGVNQLLKSITFRPDLVTTLLNPLHAIMQRYGRTLDLSDEKNKLEVAEAAPAVTPQAEQSSFSDDYE